MWQDSRTLPAETVALFGPQVSVAMEKSPLGGQVEVPT